MNKTKLKALSVLGAVGIFLSAMTTSSMAFSIGAGVTGGAAHINIAGTETLKSGGGTGGETNSGNGDAQAGVPSVYIQAIVGEGMFGEGNGFALGVDYKIGEGKMHKSSGTRMDALAADKNYTTENYAEIVAKNYYTIFVETPGFTPLGLYLKGGWSFMDIETNEELGTGSQYGDTDVEGATVGIGFKKSAGGFQIKTEFAYTDFDSVEVTSTGTGDSGGNKVKATPEVWVAQIGIGYNF